MDRLKIELLNYRIVRRNIRKMVNNLPFDSMTPTNYEATVRLNITVQQVFKMYEEIYDFSGYKYYKEAERELRNEKFFSLDSWMEIVRQWLIDNAGTRILSVHATLIDQVIAIIGQGYTNGQTIEQIARVLQRTFGWYKYQAIRIARTETATSANASIYLAGRDSNLILDKVWMSALDNRTRIEPFNHLRLHKVTIGYDEYFEPGLGDKLLYPGDINGKAGDTINCRCRIVLKPRRDKNNNLMYK